MVCLLLFQAMAEGMVAGSWSIGAAMTAARVSTDYDAPVPMIASDLAHKQQLLGRSAWFFHLLTAR